MRGNRSGLEDVWAEIYVVDDQLKFWVRGIH